MQNVACIESILFIANRPMSVKKICEASGLERDDVVRSLDALEKRYAVAESGLRLLRQGDEVQIGTSPDSASIVQKYLKEETTGELTKPALETLTIIGYRGPLSKAELEQIRGVNCTLILRNLLMRGLIEAKGDGRDGFTEYEVTVDFLRFLGIGSVKELPEYEKLRSHETIATLLSENTSKK
jgi:segregation and condensation protein B